MSNKTILIVEDMDVNIKLYSLILEPLDLNIIVAKTGNEAIKMIKENEIDLVTIDIQLPDKNGLEVIREVREFKKNDDLKFMAVTGYAMEEDKKKILDAGCSYYMAKPIDTDKFFTQVKEILEL